jgi:hypothetical protein
MVNKNKEMNINAITKEFSTAGVPLLSGEAEVRSFGGDALSSLYTSAPLSKRKSKFATKKAGISNSGFFLYHLKRPTIRSSKPETLHWFV